MKPSSEDQIPFLKIGTEVSAKYRGAFCEAKVKHVEPMVKCRVTLKDFPGTFHIDHNAIRGGLDSLKVGADISVLASAVDLPTSEADSTFVPATLVRFNDASVYSVVFNDGDERTLRRSQLVLKGDKHFEESSTLDQLPLHNPEQFGTPVIGKRRGRTTRAGPSGSSSQVGSLAAGDDSGSESGQSGASGRISHYVRRLAKLVGCIVKVGASDAAAGMKNVPSLVVVPSANPASEVRANQLLVKSYRDNRFHVVNVRSVTPMNREALVKEANASQDKGFVAAVERALLWLDSKELPHAWADRETLLGRTFGEASGDEEGSGGDSTDSESGSTTQEQRDHWLAMLFNFMDSIGSPINKVPTVANKDLDLYRLARIVRRLGGSSRVSRDMRWPLVSSKMRLPPVSSAYASIRSAYARYLQQFEDFTRKIGTPSMSFPSGGRRTSATSRGGGGQLTPRERRPSQSQEGATSAEARRKSASKEEAPASPPTLTPRPSGEAPSSGGDSEPQPPTLVAASGSSARDKRPRSLALAAHVHSSSAPASPLTDAGKSAGKSRKAPGRRRKEEEEEAKGKVRGRTRTRTPAAVPGRFAVGDEVQVRCVEGGQSRVYEARINQLDGERYNVHYKGWKKRYDEWVDSSRILGPAKSAAEVKEEPVEPPRHEEPEKEVELRQEEPPQEEPPQEEGSGRQRRDRARSADPVAKSEAEVEEAQPVNRRSVRRQPRRGVVKSEPSSAAEEEKEPADAEAEAVKEEHPSPLPSPLPSPMPLSFSPATSPTPRLRRRRPRSEIEREAKRPRAEVRATEQVTSPPAVPVSGFTPREEESSEEGSEEAAKSGESPADVEVSPVVDAEVALASRLPDVLSGQEEVVSKLDCPSTPSTDGMLVDKENVCSEEAIGEADDEDGTEDDDDDDEEEEDEEEEDEGMEVDEDDHDRLDDIEDEEEEGTSMVTGDELDAMHGAEDEEGISTAGDDFEEVESQGVTVESSGDESCGTEPRSLRPRPFESPPSPGSSQAARRRARFVKSSGIRPRSRTFSNGGGPGPSSASSPEATEPPTISLELPGPPPPTMSRLRPFVRPTPSFIPDNLDQVQSYEEREKILVDSIKACQQRWREVKQEMKELDREEAQRRAKRRRRKSSQNPPVLSAVYTTPPPGLLPRSAASTPDSTAPVPCIASSS